MLAATVSISLLLLVGCSTSSSHKGPASTSKPSTEVSQGSNTTVASAELSDALDEIGLQPSDVRAGYSVRLVPGGDQVTDQVTLDLCNARYASEIMRIARHQVAVLSSNSTFLMSTESVGYSSTAGPTDALSELDDAATHCPPGFTVPLVQGEPPLKTTFNPRPDKGWPEVAGVGRLAFDATLSNEQGHSERSITVYLARGRVLLGVYFNGVSPAVPIDGKATLEAIVGIFEHRLSTLPAATVG